MTQKKPYLIRGNDGFLRRANGFTEPYSEPNEAIIGRVKGVDVFVCTESKYTGYIGAGAPCGKKAKHDPDHNGNPTKCGHHSAAAKQRKKDKADERHRKWQEKWSRDSAVRALNVERDEIIQKIAAGHNDPRGLCQDWLDAMAKLKGGDA